MSKSINKERMIEMKKEEKYYQIYRIHLLNGEVIEASEEYDLPVEKGLVGKFQKADDNKIFEIGDAVSGVFYIPKRSILFIATGEVRKGCVNMEVKINKEIRNYRESMFFGLSMRSSFFLSLPAAWRWLCIFFSVPTLARKH